MQVGRKKRGWHLKTLSLSPQCKKLLEDAATRLYTPESFLAEAAIMADPRINPRKH
jgi:hypothetical protein